MYEEVMGSDELLLLLNLARMGGAKSLKISYPILNQPLLTLDLKDFTIKDVIERSTFEKLQKSALEGKDISTKEIPHYGDYKDCLLSSGCLSFGNHKEIRKELLNLCSESQSGTRLLRPLFLGLDTNIAYFRFFSRSQAYR